jgi:4-hydroxy-2-oxoheptanedioate aldolase
MSVEGVTGAFIGPYDLCLSQGLPGASDGDEIAFVKSIAKICAIGKKIGKPVGSMGSAELLTKKRTEEGMEFLLVSFDYSALIQGYKAQLEAAKKGIRLTKFG